MTVTIDNRLTVVSWWLYYKADVFAAILGPKDYYKLIEEVEKNLKECDAKLAKQYEEYIPLF